MERVPCEFFLIRYVPNVTRGHFANIGVVLREAVEPRRSVVRFTRDWRDVSCIHADADVELLEGLEQEIVRRLKTGVTRTDAKGVIEGFEDTLSNSLQITPGRATLAENLATEMELLMRMYVEPLKAEKTRIKSGRAAIFDGLRREFERVGAWEQMWKRVPAAKYTRKGDSLRIDCGYKVRDRASRASADEIVRMFQAVSLAGEGETASVLAASLVQLQDGVGRVERATLQLTAVVEPLRTVGDPEDDEDEAVARYEFGRIRMEEKGIRVMTTSELAGMAATAQRELGLAS